jgi:DNA-binding LytR/AlgR family response regulator
MKLDCIIVEDEPLARNLLEQYISKIPNLNLLHSISNPVEALEILRDSEVDILFLDVQMPEITGITLLKLLKKKPIIILTTAYSEYAIEGYELDVTDYLLKPITFERFLKAVEKASTRLSEHIPEKTASTATHETKETSDPFFFVKDGTKLIRVNFNDIQFIEGLKDYVQIQTADKKITTLQRMKSLEGLLPTDRFLRVHHSYIVGLNWIDVVERDGLRIGNKLIPISDTYKRGFKAYIDKKKLDSK